MSDSSSCMIESSNSSCVNESSNRAVLRLLKESFITVRNQHSRWKAEISSGAKSLESLDNLSEQYYCCNEVCLESTPLSVLEDFIDELNGKFTVAFTKTMIMQNLAALEEVQLRISVQYQKSFSLYVKYREYLQNSQDASLLWPSIDDLIISLQQIDSAFINEFESRKYLVTHINWGMDRDALEELVVRWNDTQKTDACLQDKLFQVKFLLEETI